MLGRGAFASWRKEQLQIVRQRDARNADVDTAIFNQREDALRANDTAKAAVLLEAAKKRSAEGGTEKAVPRLKGLDADLAVTQDLDAVDEFRWIITARPVFGRFRWLAR